MGAVQAPERSVSRQFNQRPIRSIFGALSEAARLHERTMKHVGV